MFEGCVFLGENGLSFIVMESPAIRYYTKSQAYICPSFWYNTTIGSILGGWWGFSFGGFSVLVWRRIQCVFTFLVLMLRHTVVCLYGLGFFFGFFGSGVETHSMRLYFLVLLLRHTAVGLYFCSFFVVFSVLAWRRIQCVFTFFGFVVETHGCGALWFMVWVLGCRCFFGDFDELGGVFISV